MQQTLYNTTQILFLFLGQDSGDSNLLNGTFAVPSHKRLKLSPLKENKEKGREGSGENRETRLLDSIKRPTISIDSPSMF